VPPNSTDLNPLHYCICGAILKNYPKLQHKTITRLEVALQTIWDELPQEHINNAAAKFSKHLTAYMAVANGGQFEHRLCSNSIHLQVCILISSNKPALFIVTNRLLANTVLATLRNGVVLVETA